MTLYWWSHWFWITMLSTLILSASFVKTYPSQEFALESNEEHAKSTQSVTKLYRSTTTGDVEWATTAPSTKHNEFNHTESLRLLKAAAAAEVNEKSTKDNAAAEQKQMTESKCKELELALKLTKDLKVETDASAEDTFKAINAEQQTTELQYKRSAEYINNNKTHEKAVTKDAVDDVVVVSGDISSADGEILAAKVATKEEAAAAKDLLKSTSIKSEVDNYTNFTGKVGLIGNKSHDLLNNNNSKIAAHMNIPAAATNTSNSRSANNVTAAAAAAPPARPRIHSGVTGHGTVEWLNAMPTTESDVEERVPFTLENVNKEDELRRAESEHRSRKSKVLSADYKHINRYINFSSDTKSLLTRSAASASSSPPHEFDNDDSGNISSEALSIQRTYFLDAGTISAICFTIFGICCAVGTIGIVMYRRRFLNKPQTLSEPDSSVYIDDSTMRDNSDEMYSLDNDSFLNSLEAMTIQNYWTDTVKHTKL